MLHVNSVSIILNSKLKELEGLLSTHDSSSLAQQVDWGRTLLEKRVCGFGVCLMPLFFHP